MSGRWHRPSVLSKPEQGWSSLLLLLALLTLLGISIANARAASLVLKPDAASVAASLPVLMIASGLIGFFLAPRRRQRVHRLRRPAHLEAGGPASFSVRTRLPHIPKRRIPRDWASTM